MTIRQSCRLALAFALGLLAPSLFGGKIVVFDGENFQGESMAFRDAVPDLDPTGFNDRAASAPGNYYRRIHAFLRSFEPRAPGPRLSPADVKAFLKSLWLPGVWHPGRSRYWMLFWSTLLASPRKLPTAVELSILGHHFRKVASSL